MGAEPGDSAPAAWAATAAVASADTWAALEAALILVRAWHPEPDRGRTGPLVTNPDVVDLATALDLAPAVGEQVLVLSLIHI